MKKLYIAVFFLLASFIQSAAQGIYQFWGITDGGGTDGQGVLFSSKYDGSGIKSHKTFELETPGGNPSDNGLINYNGRLFGTMPHAGEGGAGMIYEYDPVANTYVRRADFHRINGALPKGNMVVFQNKLYGITTLGGNNNVDGVLFEYDPATNNLVAKHYFEEETGITPLTGLTVHNNKLYGSVSIGGFDGCAIFSYDPVTNVYAKIKEMTFALGIEIRSPFISHNNRLYGVASGGGSTGSGTLFEFNPANNAVVKIGDMEDINGYQPGGLVLFNNKLYGGCWLGGQNEAGLIFEYDLVQHTFAKKIDLTEANGKMISAQFIAHNNKLYGLTRRGGFTDEGTLFEYDPATNIYLKKVNFSALTRGRYPMSALVSYNSKLYGLTSEGGVNGFGALFEYSPDFNGFTKKIDLMMSATGYIPRGKLTYYSGKLYGMTTYGGANNKGVIFSYDLATGTYEVRYNMTAATGYAEYDGGMVLYNNKLYGITRESGNGDVDNIDRGVLFEFNLLNDNYTVKHYFTKATGFLPEGVPVVYNNKLYGTAAGGGNNNAGVLYEYDLATNTYAVKVMLGGSFGKWPIGLTLHNERMYGSTVQGGANDAGVLFEYIPAGNGFIKRYDFLSQSYAPSSPMVVLNNKLYTTVKYTINPWDGALYEYDLATSTYTKKHEFGPDPSGAMPGGGLLVYNNKLYGTTEDGGIDFGGVLYEYDPVLNSYKEPALFNSLNGHSPSTTKLITVPALVAPGTPGSCTDIGNTPINAANANQWVPFTDEYGNAVLEINANGNSLGNVSVQFYTHDGTTRKDEAGRLYLDRNISIKVDNQPATPVSIRLYIRKAEFESLKNTPDAGVLNVSDLAIFKNSENCSTVAGYSATPISTTVTTWGLDYVYTAQVSSFSSFYFASKAYSALPVKLEYLKGVAEATVNRLQWKASCTENTDFIVERSTDGIHFSQIGLVWASVADCGKPFQFPDQHPVNGKAWYRLQMKEASGAVTYSSIIMIDRRQAQSLSIQLAPNPVTGSSAIFSIYSPGNKTVPVAIYDATGKLMARMQWQLQPGSQVRTIDVQKLPAGIYQAVWYEESATKAIRFVRQ